MSLGYKRPLEMSDLGALPLIHESSYNHNKFRDAFEKEKVSEFYNYFLLLSSMQISVTEIQCLLCL